MRSPRRHLFAAAVVGLALVAAGCGSDDEKTTTVPPNPPKGTVNIAAFNFSESNILAGIYEGALSNAGFTVSVRPNLGGREIVAHALERGEIDLYPGYAATDLEFYNNAAGQATPDAEATTEKLRAALAPKGATALNPSSAVGLLKPTDGSIPANGSVVPEEDKRLRNADNVVPVIRTAVASEEARQVLNMVSERLTTEELTELNRRADVDDEDPAVLAQDWLDQHGF